MSTSKTNTVMVRVWNKGSAQIALLSRPASANPIEEQFADVLSLKASKSAKLIPLAVGDNETVYMLVHPGRDMFSVLDFVSAELNANLVGEDGKLSDAQGVALNNYFTVGASLRMR
jgi:hypothetical protein